ncbi:MAG TPA: TAXI family TRAP transporter solute-binding subunit [Desulfobacteraceae bacterium]|nr:TAXI family TRAP transporter solute-binding subunit [Desulfobacteraceae bacterium]
MMNEKSSLRTWSKSFTRREFIKHTAVGIAATGVVAGVPGISFGAKVKQYTFGSASASGSWYPLSVAMSKMISENVPGYHVTGVVTPGASRENILRIDRDEMELGWSLANTLYQGYNGMEPFNKKMGVLGWFSAYPAIIHVAARKGSGIKTIADMKGKVVATGTPGSQTNIDNEKVLFPAHGLTPEKDFKVERIRFPEAVQKMIDGHIDACAYYMGAGVPGFVQMAESTDVVFIPIDDGAIGKIRELDPTLYADDLPAGTYKGQKDPVAAVHMAYTLCCGAGLAEDFMYGATKAVWENYDFICNASAVFRRSRIENVFKGMPVPVHPGAVKYFAERGVAKG